jgi:hypothetical protein
MYQQFGTNKAIRDEIIRDIEALLYLEPKGFDLEVESAYWAKNGNTQIEKKVEYWFTIENEAEGTQTNFLNLKFSERLKTFEVFGGLPFESGFELETSKKPNIPMDEEIYGKKMPMHSVIPGLVEGDDLGAVYRKVYEGANMDNNNFSKVQKALREGDMKSGHFLSTLMGGNWKASLVRNSKWIKARNDFYLSH